MRYVLDCALWNLLNVHWSEKKTGLSTLTLFSCDSQNCGPVIYLVPEPYQMRVLPWESGGICVEAGFYKNQTPPLGNLHFSSTLLKLIQPAQSWINCQTRHEWKFLTTCVLLGKWPMKSACLTGKSTSPRLSDYLGFCWALGLGFP